VATEVTRALVGAHHHGHGVPSNQRANAALHEQIARHARFLGHRDAVTEWRGYGIRQFGAIAAGSLGKPFKNVFGTVYAFVLDQRFQRIQPFTGFNGIIILVHQTLPLASKGATPATISDQRRCEVDKLRWYAVFFVETSACKKG